MLLAANIAGKDHQCDSDHCRSCHGIQDYDSLWFISHGHAVALVVDSLGTLYGSSYGELH